MQNLEKDLIDLLLAKASKLPWSAWCKSDLKCIGGGYLSHEYCNTINLSTMVIRNGAPGKIQDFKSPDRLMIAKVLMVLHYHTDTFKAKIDSINQQWGIEFKIIDDVYTIGHRNIANFNVHSGEKYCEKAMQLFQTAKKYANFATKAKQAGISKPEAFIQVLSILKQI